MKKLILIIIFLSSLSVFAQANSGSFDFSLASGVSSLTLGRHHPFINMALEGKNTVLSVITTGFKNSAMAHSTQQVSLMGGKEFGQYLWGKLNGAFGVGVQFNYREYDNSFGYQEKRRETHWGASMRVTWVWWDRLFIGAENFFGVANTNVQTILTRLAILNTMHTTYFLVGFKI